MVWYKLLAADGHTVLAEDMLPTPVENVALLRQAVYRLNNHLPVLQHCDRTDLHVYPPNTTDFSGPPARVNEKMESVLARSKPPPLGLSEDDLELANTSIILVARPPPQVESLEPPTKQRRMQPDFLDDDELVAFLNAFMGANVDEHKVLNFGTPLFGTERYNSKMLVRDCYDDLCDIILEKSDGSRVLLIGTPGIGKSLFGLYMVKKLLEQLGCDKEATEPRYVAWVRGPTDICAIFKVETDGKWTIQLLKAMLGLDYLRACGMLLSLNNWIVYDSIKPNIASTIAKSLLISSPRSDDILYNEYKKGSCKKLYMPVWSSEEMLAAQKYIYNVPSYQYKALVEVFGNIPRHVFDEKIQYDGTSYESIKVKALSVVKGIITSNATMDYLKDVYFKVIQGVLSKETHYIMHMHLDTESFEEGFTPYDSFSVAFASFAVEEEIMSLIERSETERQKLWVALSKDAFEFGSLRGILFERYAHRIIRESVGPFRIRRLADNKDEQVTEEKVTLEVTDFKFWESLSDASKYQNGIYAKPLSRNERAIDALMQPDSMFQMTVSTNHGVLRSGIQEATNILRGREKRLYFVVPSDKFDKWTTVQPYLTGRRKKSVNQNIPEVQQYALCIDMDILDKSLLKRRDAE